MPAVRLNNFGGIQPLSGVHLLPDNAAQLAANCLLASGEVVPLRSLTTTYQPSNPGPYATIYRAVAGAASTWFTWAFDVDVVKAPLPPAADARWCWTGDGEPRTTDFANAVNGGGNDYPALYFALGIPRPSSKAVATPDASGTGSNTTRFYAYTFFSQWGEESGPSPVALADGVVGKEDDVWAITGMDAFPANSGTGTASFGAGVTTFTNAAAAATWLRAGDQVVMDGDTLTVLATPSAASFTVGGDYSAETAWARKAPWNTSGMKRRLYRTTGTLGGWQLVDDDVGTTFNDTLGDGDILGDPLITETWDLPPTGLTGLCILASGSAVGYVNNTVYVSEPFQLHAWVASFNTEQDVTGVGTYGNSAVVGTRGVPYVLSGSEPASMYLTSINQAYPCLAKRSMASVGDGCVFSSGAGLVVVNEAGATLLTRDKYTEQQWRDLNPETMFCCATPRRLYVNYTANSGMVNQLVFDEGRDTTAQVECSDMWADADTGYLFVGTNSAVERWNASESASLYATWRSKEFTPPMPISIGAAKVHLSTRFDDADIAARQAEIDAVIAANAVLFAAGDLGGGYNDEAINTLAINGDTLVAIPPGLQTPSAAFSLYIDGLLAFSSSVSDAQMIRVPQLAKYDRLAVEVTTNATLRHIVFGPTPMSLKNA